MDGNLEKIFMALGSRFTYILLMECIVIKEQSKDEILWIVDSRQNLFSLCTSKFFAYTVPVHVQFCKYCMAKCDLSTWHACFDQNLDKHLE